MARVTVHHLTLPARLPLIEEQGLRTRADLSTLLGPPTGIDTAAPGLFANGKRVSGYLSLAHAQAHVDEHGPGLVSYSVDPAKTLASPSPLRDGDATAYWEAAKPLSQWLADGDAPDDLEVHTNVGIRAKFLRLQAPLFTDDHLGPYAPLVAAVADTDRLSAKALMHLAIIASDGDFDSHAFNAACALAWRDEPDPDSLTRELVELDPDKIASAALAELGSQAPDAVALLRDALDATRELADENGMSHAKGILTHTAMILENLPSA